MALDMYIAKRTYVGNNMREKKDQLRIKGEGIRQERVVLVFEEVAYWRNATHIHRWFVENNQAGYDDGLQYSINRAALRALLDLCKEVRQHPEQAGDLLPTEKGDYWAAPERGGSYWRDTEATIEILSKILAEEPADSVFYYQAIESY